MFIKKHEGKKIFNGDTACLKIWSRPWKHVLFIEYPTTNYAMNFFIKEKKSIIKESSIKDFASYYSYDIKSVREAIKYFPEEMKKEITNFEKIMQSWN